MKHLLLLAVGGAISITSYSQQNPDVQNWVIKHSDVILISSENYASISEEYKLLVQHQGIIFTNELTMEDIHQYELQHPVITPPVTEPTVLSDAQIIKNWLGINQGVTIITRSEYEALSSEGKTKMIELGALILIGEEITIEDINNF